MDYEIRKQEIVERLDFEAMDKPEEIMAEACGIGVVQAKRALAWMREQDENQHDHDLADTLLRALNLVVISTNPFVCGLRAMALRWLIRDEGEPMTALAERCGVSKQLLSFHIRKLERQTGLHNAAQKRSSCRPIYSQTAKERWRVLDAAQRRARRNSKRYRAELAALAEAGIDPAEIGATPAAHLTTGQEQNENIPDSK